MTRTERMIENATAEMQETGNPFGVTCENDAEGNEISCEIRKTQSRIKAGKSAGTRITFRVNREIIKKANWKEVIQ